MYVCELTHATAHMWKSKDNFMELVLPSNFKCYLVIELVSPGLCGVCFYLWIHVFSPPSHLNRVFIACVVYVCACACTCHGL